MLDGMPLNSERLTSLRHEITNLSNQNTSFREQKSHGPLDKSAAELRVRRLAEIKQELSKLLNKPDSSAWW
jgi:hypothetical protein